jgi:hypothetical protein
MADLIWECVRNNNSFLRHGARVTLSAENGNLLSKNSFKYSGLTGKAAGLKLAQKGKKQSIVMTAPSRKIAASTTVSKNNATAFKAINKVLGSTRPNAVATAKRAYLKIKQALRK